MRKLAVIVAPFLFLAVGCGDDTSTSNDLSTPPAAIDMAQKQDAAPSADMAMVKPTNYTVTLNRAQADTAGEACTAGTSPGANATGTGTVAVTVDGANSKVVVHLVYSGLSGPATLAHIHHGAPGTQGGVALPFKNLGADATDPTKGTIDVTFTSADYGTSADFNTFLTTEMNAGKTYFNIHTGNCKGGEIRGDIK